MRTAAAHDKGRKTALLAATLAMAGVVALSNVLVQHPIRSFGLQDWLTWGALSYPLAFLVTDLSNRRLGPAPTRIVIYVGFALGVALSIALATPRIAAASGIAFLAGQLVDIRLFQALRWRAWWMAPLVSSIIGSALDTALFFSLAFHCGPLPLVGGSIDGLLLGLGIAGQCEGLPWQTLALADFAVKLAMALLALIPYGLLARRWREAPAAA